METPPWEDDDYVDECYVVGGCDGMDAADWSPDPAELAAVARNELEGLTVQSRMMIADGYRVIAEVLREAEASPEPWMGPDPTLDPGWVDRRNRSIATVRRERREFGVRAAAANIAVRLRMSEATVHARAYDAETLRARCPRVWGGFLSGDIPEPNARAAAAGARAPGRLHRRVASVRRSGRRFCGTVDAGQVPHSGAGGSREGASAVDRQQARGGS